MKCTIKMLKTGLVALFLLAGLTVSAQQLISSTDQTKLRPPLSGTGTETIFAHENTSFRLTASTTSSSTDGQADITFDNIKWYFKNDAGGFGDLPDLNLTTATVSGTANSQLTLNGLKPGFYTFMAVGETAGEVCVTEPEEFTVFVLPPLTVTLSSDLQSNIYCQDDLPPTSNNTLTASVSFDATHSLNTQTPYSSTNPTLGDFELRYRWYKVTENGTLDIQATPLAIHTPSANTTTDTYNVVETELGRWKYYVVVDYTVKNSGPYQTVLGGGTPTIIEVTPKPGRPTITIEAVTP